MFRPWRLKRIHRQFLESCRNLKEGRDYWRAERTIAHGLLEFMSPVPLLGLHSDGSRLYEALLWLELHCKKQPLREEGIREYHRLICDPKTSPSGEYRRGQASVVDSKVPRPPYQKVSALMMQLDGRLASGQEGLEEKKPIEPENVFRLAIEVHQRLAFIHPFDDGNGRVARLAMNHILRRYDHGYVILPPVSESPEHFQAMEEAHRGNLESLIQLASASLRRV